MGHVDLKKSLHLRLKSRYSKEEKEEVLEFVEYMTQLTSFSRREIAKLLSLNRATYYNQLGRSASDQLAYIKPVVYNPDRLLDWEKEAIRDYYLLHQDNGYRRLTYMMIDQDVVYASPSTVYRYLKSQGLLMRWAENKSIGPRPEDPKAPARRNTKKMTDY